MAYLLAIGNISNNFTESKMPTSDFTLEGAATEFLLLVKFGKLEVGFLCLCFPI